MEFSSAGFDLDALGNGDGGGGDENVVYEIGGGATRIEPPPEETSKRKEAGGNTNNDDDNDNVLKEADALKEEGNAAFRSHNWQTALEKYTAAIQATPGISGSEILKQREEWRIKEQKRVRLALQEQDEQKRQEKMAKRQQEEEQRQQQQQQQSTEKHDEATKPPPETAKTAESSSSKEAAASSSSPPAPAPEPFEPPPHPHSEKLAIYHCNRAATLLQLERYPAALDDCDISILLRPTYTKAFVRRCKTHEVMEHTDLALEDAKTALKLEPTNVKHRQTVKRLEKLEAERMEKLKAETMDKLKDLGNSILGNFGLSLDNFKAVQDPNTGSYSISFDQNNGNKEEG